MGKEVQNKTEKVWTLLRTGTCKGAQRIGAGAMRLWKEEELRGKSILSRGFRDSEVADALSRMGRGGTVEERGRGTETC